MIHNSWLWTNKTTHQHTVIICSWISWDSWYSKTQHTVYIQDNPAKDTWLYFALLKFDTVA